MIGLGYSSFFVLNAVVVVVVLFLFARLASARPGEVPAAAVA